MLQGAEQNLAKWLVAGKGVVGDPLSTGSVAASGGALADGWPRVEQPNEANVLGPQQQWRDLDDGEAETIVLAGLLGGRRPTILVDEGDAFRFLRTSAAAPGPEHATRLLGARATSFGGDGDLPQPAADAMLSPIDNGDDAWASNVRRHSEAWCQETNTSSLPALPLPYGR